MMLILTRGCAKHKLTTFARVGRISKAKIVTYVPCKSLLYECFAFLVLWIVSCSMNAMRMSDK